MFYKAQVPGAFQAIFSMGFEVPPVPSLKCRRHSVSFEASSSPGSTPSTINVRCPSVLEASSIFRLVTVLQASDPLQDSRRPSMLLGTIRSLRRTKFVKSPNLL